ncbi:MAG: hypothetical protein V7746_12800 [Halioglobus sp.]
MTANRTPLVLASLVFLLSGCSALIFETVWFRVASVALGSSMWSAAAVLMAFMTGLGLGNAAMAFWGSKIQKPFRFYVMVEIIIAVSGIASIFALPVLAPALAGSVSTSHGVGVLNTIRFGVAFGVFLLPATAMGATLPVLQKAIHALDDSFLRSIGRLYGWNTVGAVVGVLLAEFVLIAKLGVQGAGLVACALNIVAALVVALWLGRHKIEMALPATPGRFLTGKVCLLLLPPFLVGFLLLALEVVWFRYILLTQMGTSIVFAMMLAIVLLGIGLGGLIVTRLNLSDRKLVQWLYLLPVASCLFVYLGYEAYEFAVTHAIRFFFYNHYLFIIPAILLMLPTSIVSGMLFPLFGQHLFSSLAVNTRASGSLTLVNTTGAALGSAFATFYLLPQVGVEDALLLLAMGYLLPSVILIFAVREIRKPLLLAVPCAAFILVALLFPSGSLYKSYEKIGELRFPGEKLVSVREELNGTLLYYQTDFLEQPLSFRLATNNYSMSGSSYWSERYMKLYAYFPYIFKRDIEDVLLISYGVGMTAEGVTRLKSLKQLDIVDISKAIVEMSAITHEHREGIFPPEDQRVTVHIEDGRFYMQTVNKTYDLITGEPPPPKMAGIANLYTQEYFELMHSRLNPGGIATYWLPVHDLHETDSLAIIRAYCNAFPDCSLWNGGGIEFMLVGSKGGLNKLSFGKVRSAWYSEIGDDLRYIGLEKPGQLGALFMADSEMLEALTAGVKPVTDNYPHRILPSYSGLELTHPLYSKMLDIRKRKEAFKLSDYIYEIFEPDMIGESLAWFELEATLTHLQVPFYLEEYAIGWEKFTNLILTTELRTTPALWLGTNPARQRVFAHSEKNNSAEYQLESIYHLVLERKFPEASIAAKAWFEQFKGELEAIRALEIYLVFGAIDRNGLDSELELALEENEAELDQKFVRWLRGL